jgi:preprotein translocase subunit SecG
MVTSIALTVMLSRSSGDHSVLSGSHPVTQTTPKK